MTMYECDNSVSYTNSNIIIRSVIETDFEQWLPLWHGYNVFYKRTSFPMDITPKQPGIDFLMSTSRCMLWWRKKMDN